MSPPHLRAAVDPREWGRYRLTPSFSAPPTVRGVSPPGAIGNVPASAQAPVGPAREQKSIIKRLPAPHDGHPGHGHLSVHDFTGEGIRGMPTEPGEPREPIPYTGGCVLVPGPP